MKELLVSLHAPDPSSSGARELSYFPSDCSGLRMGCLQNSCVDPNVTMTTDGENFYRKLVHDGGEPMVIKVVPRRVVSYHESELTQSVFDSFAFLFCILSLHVISST